MFETDIKALKHSGHLKGPENKCKCHKCLIFINHTENLTFSCMYSNVYSSMSVRFESFVAVVTFKFSLIIGNQFEGSSSWFT